MWPDDGDANCALWDQVRALEWVGENIASFGGDPDNVTIGGESAGAGCSTCLVASPIANKLFHRAVIMSTVAQCTDDERTAKIRSSQFARALGAASINVTDFAGFSGIEFVAAPA
jgi:para-nitrobenzyl esterase